MLQYPLTNIAPDFISRYSFEKVIDYFKPELLEIYKSHRPVRKIHEVVAPPNVACNGVNCDSVVVEFGSVGDFGNKKIDGFVISNSSENGSMI